MSILWALFKPWIPKNIREGVATVTQDKAVAWIENPQTPKEVVLAGNHQAGALAQSNHQVVFNLLEVVDLKLCRVSLEEALL